VDAADDIAEFLATRRARITPEQAGLPSYGKRRVPGLRREEVASPAGVSADYYRRLERGQVSGDQIEAPAVVSSVYGDYLAANGLGRALYAPVFESPEQPANSARFTFLDPAAPGFYPAAPAVPTHFEATIGAYRAAEKMLAGGRARAIGVSNFSPQHLRNLIDRTDVVPAVNQVELHPYFTQPALCEVHAELGIVTQAWSPLGGVLVYVPGSDESRGPLTDPLIADLAAEYGKTPAQVVLRWHIEHGFCAIPKSVKPHRIAEKLRPLRLLADRRGGRGDRRAGQGRARGARP
jgi:Aldo/keto reductase family/MmyB-like transcription regulator ligand binding domain/Helix-turn-helix domain